MEASSPAPVQRQTHALDTTTFVIDIRIWSPDMPHLYDVSLKLTNHQANDIDTVESYVD